MNQGPKNHVAADPGKTVKVGVLHSHRYPDRGPEPTEELHPLRIFWLSITLPRGSQKNPAATIETTLIFPGQQQGQSL
jgi:hypothetical protein